MVPVTRYVVVESGDAKGAGMFALLNPATGSQENVAAPLAEMVELSPAHIEIAGCATVTTGEASFVMIALVVSAHPPLSVTVTSYVPAFNPVAVAAVEESLHK